MKPIPEKEFHPTGQQGNTPHDSIAKTCSECNHKHPDTHPRGFAEKSFMLLGKEEINQGREDTDNADASRQTHAQRFSVKIPII